MRAGGGGGGVLYNPVCLSFAGVLYFILYFNAAQYEMQTEESYGRLNKREQRITISDFDGTGRTALDLLPMFPRLRHRFVSTTP